MALLESLPSVNVSNLEKIESFLNDPAYREALESSANYNTRLCIERRLRMPFLDSQTGVAQNHSQLFMPKRQRIPGLLPGQIYSYPRARWRKKRRQYLLFQSRSFARTDHSMLDGDGDLHNISQVENPALQDTDSKDSQLLKDEVSKDWFYDEQDMLEMEGYDEPDADSDFDYEESYSKRKRNKKAGGKGRGGVDSPSTPRRGKGGGRGRKKATHSFEPMPGDPDKPFGCELCGARYKTRPGLTYHYSHSHRDGASDDNSRDSVGVGVVAPPTIAVTTATTLTTGAGGGNSSGSGTGTVISNGLMGGGGIMSASMPPNLLNLGHMSMSMPPMPMHQLQLQQPQLSQQPPPIPISIPIPPPPTQQLSQMQMQLMGGPAGGVMPILGAQGNGNHNTMGLGLGGLGGVTGTPLDGQQPQLQPSSSQQSQQNAAAAAASAAAAAQGHVYQDSYVTFLNHPAGTPGRRGRQPASAQQQQQQNQPPQQQPPLPPQQQPPLPQQQQQPPQQQQQLPPMPPHPSHPLAQPTPPNLPPNPPPSMQVIPDDPPMPILTPEKKINNKSSNENSNSPSGSNNPVADHPHPPEKGKAAPSPYCDFCLGDSRENKKTGTSEDLVSCSDCGRSGKARLDLDKKTSLLQQQQAVVVPPAPTPTPTPGKKGRKKKNTTI